MGTNFYWHENTPCHTCGHERGVVRHIGKSSAGWCFALHVYPEDEIEDLEHWICMFSEPGSFIVDEYGTRYSAEGILARIRERSWPHERTWTKEDMSQNMAEPGPNGLVRHRLGEACIKQGSGTWDCLIGDFC